MLDFSQLFPEAHRSFFCGPLSLDVERFGGINEVSLLDIRSFGGRSYPDRFPIPWLCRKKSSTMNRPLYSPGIQFRHGNDLYVPLDAELFPFGFRSVDYSLAVRETSAVFAFRCPPGETFSMNLSALHLPEGVMPTLKNQLAVRACNIQWLPPELRGENFDQNLPFPEKDLLLTRKSPVFDGRRIIFEALCRYEDYEDRQFWVIAVSGGEAELIQIPNGWMLKAVPAGETLELGFGFGKSAEEACRRAERSFRQNFEEGLAWCRPALTMVAPELTDAREFFELYPGYQRHLRIFEDEKFMAVRAAGGNYGFCAMWDDIYPARDFLLLGEAERTRKMLRYMIEYPWAETCPWVTIQLIPAVNEYLAYAEDPEFLLEVMPRFREFFNFCLRFVNADTGLLATSLSAGVDCSAEAGMEGLFYASCLNGWWFDAVRCLENFAGETGDEQLRLQCRKLGARIEAHYQKLFWDEQEGFLRAGLTQDGSLPDIQVFQNTHTLGMDYLPGPYLFRKMARKLARYFADRLRHPMGLTAVAPDSAVPCEMWKAVHMNQHLGHECKLLRMAGRSEEAVRIMAGYLKYFTAGKCAMETFNLAGCVGDEGIWASWQAFSATGAAQGLLVGTAGWQKHRGGWSWIPGKYAESRIENLDGHIFTVEKAGCTASGIILDGELVRGTLQVPADRKAVKYTVCRENQRPDYPVLLMAADLPVTELRQSGRSLSFRLNAERHSFLVIEAPEKPVLKINGREVGFEWMEEDCRLWLDRIFEMGDMLEVLL